MRKDLSCCLKGINNEKAWSMYFRTVIFVSPNLKVHSTVNSPTSNSCFADTLLLWVLTIADKIQIPGKAIEV